MVVMLSRRVQNETCGGALLALFLESAHHESLKWTKSQVDYLTWCELGKSLHISETIDTNAATFNMLIPHIERKLLIRDFKIMLCSRERILKIRENICNYANLKFCIIIKLLVILISFLLRLTGICLWDHTCVISGSLHRTNLWGNKIMRTPPWYFYNRHISETIATNATKFGTLILFIKSKSHT